MTNQTRTLAALAIVFESWFVVALIALHLLRPDLAPSRTMISRFAVGPYGSLMTSAFVAAGLADLMLLLALLCVGPRAIAALPKCSSGGGVWSGNLRNFPDGRCSCPDYCR